MNRPNGIDVQLAEVFTQTEMIVPGKNLDPDAILSTVTILGNRIRERFPNAGLSLVCDDLTAIARQARQRSIAIAKPMMGIRVGSALLILLILLLFGAAIQQVRIEPTADLHIIEVLEAAFNVVLLIGAVIVFLITLEVRIKRSRALKAVHELRSVAHIIDMHQLTKDPERILSGGPRTKSSPKMQMTKFELNRYLDYCSEMLALCGKIAALYVDNFTDADAVAAVNDLENLTSGLARKIWQKIMVLDAQDENPNPSDVNSQETEVGLESK